MHNIDDMWAIFSLFVFGIIVFTAYLYRLCFENSLLMIPCHCIIQSATYNVPKPLHWFPGKTEAFAILFGAKFDSKKSVMSYLKHPSS